MFPNIFGLPYTTWGQLNVLIVHSSSNLLFVTLIAKSQ